MGQGHGVVLIEGQALMDDHYQVRQAYLLARCILEVWPSN